MSSNGGSGTSNNKTGWVILDRVISLDGITRRCNVVGADIFTWRAAQRIGNYTFLIAVLQTCQDGGQLRIGLTINLGFGLGSNGDSSRSNAKTGRDI